MGINLYRSRILAIAGCLTVLVLAGGCDVFRLQDESTALSGRWSSDVVARSGDCCEIDLTLEVEEDVVTGQGTINTPGQRIGETLQFSIEVTGQFLNDRLELQSTSQANPVFIEGSLDRQVSTSNNKPALRVNFEGFGRMGRDILLFQR